jgi:hypothetical protein
MFDDVSSVINSFIASSNVFLVIYAALCLINGLVCKLELISGCQPGPEGAPGRQSPGANWPSKFRKFSSRDAADVIMMIAHGAVCGRGHQISRNQPEPEKCKDSIVLRQYQRSS